MFFCFHLMPLWLYPISPINLKFFKGRTCSSVISTAPASFSTEVRIQYIDILVEEIFCMYYRRGYSVRQNVINGKSGTGRAGTGNSKDPEL